MLNKELILKYRSEFDHLVNGGTCLYKLQSDKWYQNAELIFTDYDYKDMVSVVIINDQYVDFREALANGKVIETMIFKNDYPSSILMAHKRKLSGKEIWVEMEKESEFIGPLCCYRIKE